MFHYPTRKSCANDRGHVRGRNCIFCLNICPCEPIHAKKFKMKKSGELGKPHNEAQ